MRLVSILFSLLAFSFLLEAQLILLPGDFHKAYITGTITSGGKQVADAEIFAHGETGEALAVSAWNGNYSLGIGAGKWTVVVSKENCLTPPPQTVEVAADGTRENVNFDLKKSNAYIEGIVVDENSRPLPYSMVMAMPNFMKGKHGAEEGPAVTPMKPGSFPTAHCDKDGNFFLHVMAGSYLLSAMKPGYRLSPRNPHPTIPGMENLPPQILEKMQGSLIMGVPVDVAEGETRKGIVIILEPYETKSGKPGSFTPSHETVVKPFPNILVGKACLTPNNVLHWTRKDDEKRKEQNLSYAIVRSTLPLDNKINRLKAEIKTFQFPYYMYGEPGEKYYSFTDPSGKPGVTYYYYVYEVGTNGSGPYSNPAKLSTP